MSLLRLFHSSDCCKILTQLFSLNRSVRPNTFLDAAFHRFDGGNKQKEVRVRTSTVKRGVFLGSRWLKAASKNLFGRTLQPTYHQRKRETWPQQTTTWRRRQSTAWTFTSQIRSLSYLDLLLHCNHSWRFLSWLGVLPAHEWRTFVLQRPAPPAVQQLACSWHWFDGSSCFGYWNDQYSGW